MKQFTCVNCEIGSWRFLWNKINSLSELFKIFGDPTRLKIINILLNEEKCVSDISNILNISQSAISHQLKILKTSKLVKYTKKGKEVYYSLFDNHVQKIFELVGEHINEI